MDLVTRANGELAFADDVLKTYQSFGSHLCKKLLVLSDTIKQMDLDQLERKITPSSSQDKLKLALWQCYHDSLSKDTPLNHMDVIHKASCTPHFFSKCVNDPYVLWWLMTPSRNYQSELQLLLIQSLRKQREILNLDLHDQEVNKDVINAKLKLIESINDRAVGAVEKRHHIKEEKSSSKPIRTLAVDDEIQQLQEELHGKV